MFWLTFISYLPMIMLMIVAGLISLLFIGLSRVLGNLRALIVILVMPVAFALGLLAGCYYKGVQSDQVDTVSSERNR